MVGFIQESCKQEDEVVVNRQKIKNPNCPESFRFDFEGYSSEFGGFSLASTESFLDFDSIKDWLEEMQVPDSAGEANKSSIESGSCVESSLDNQIGTGSVDAVQDRNGAKNPVSVNAECSAPDEGIENRDVICMDDSSVKLDGMKDCNMDNLTTEAEFGSSLHAETSPEARQGDTETSHGDGDESGVGVLGDTCCHKVETLESLNCLIKEGPEKATLVGDEGAVVVSSSDKVKVDISVVNEDCDSGSDSDSDSECETSSSSSSSASSSSSESDDDDNEEEVKEKEALAKLTIDVEEGQIVDSDAENKASLSTNIDDDDDDDDDDVNFAENSEEFHIEDEDANIVKGPIKSKNELEVLPPVPPVNVTLEPCHEIMPVGVVLSVVGTRVVVEGSEKHNPLSEGSILWVAETRLPLGLVDEIFGPVKTPFYTVRYNSESEVPSGVQNGTSVGFVPEFVEHVLNDKKLYQKGYDASGENDEELSDQDDFSDDEKEAEYKRKLKMSKRENSNQSQGSGNMKKNRMNNRNRDKTWTKDQPATSRHPPTLRSSQPNQMQQHGPHVPIPRDGSQLGPSPFRPVLSGGPAVPPPSQGNQLGPSQMQPFYPNGPMAFPHQMQQAGYFLNGFFANGMPLQQQNMGVPGGFQMNGMPWMQQNHPQNFQVPSAGPAPWQQQQHVLQMPLPNSAQSQQQQHVLQMSLPNSAQSQQPFDLSQLVAGAATTPLGPLNFSAGPTNAPWLNMSGQHHSNQAPQNMGPQGASQLPAMQGHEGAPPQFSHGPSSGRGGRGRGRRPFHHKGGHFGGGRGRQQPN